MYGMKKFVRKDLGFRKFDVDHNWHESKVEFNSIPISKLKTFIKDQQRIFNELNLSVNRKPFNYLDFEPSPCQQTFIDLFDTFLEKNKEDQEKFPLTVLTAGAQGTGKSKLIEYATTKLTDLGIGYLVCAFTGTAAYQVGGQTLHSMLGIRPLENDFEKIASELETGKSDREAYLLEKFIDKEVIIIDEYSFCGARMLQLLNKTLQHVFCDARDFGGRSILMFGDHLQLQCIGDIPVWTPPEKIQGQQFAAEGCKAFRNLKHTILLYTNMRQPGDHKFRDLLKRIRHKSVSVYDFQELENRFQNKLTSKERSEFRDAVHLYPNNQAAEEFNIVKLAALDQPIAVVRNAYIPAHAKPPFLNPDNSNLYLGVGARVLLTRNLWTAHGLTNGARGYVKGILYKDYERPPDNQPEVVLVQFEGYAGPKVFGNLVPIPLVDDPVYSPETNQTYRIRSIPLLNAFGITIHKAQGMTLSKVAIQLTAAECFSCMTYVALSRVKKLKDIMILPPFFGLDRFLNKKFYSGFNKLKEESLRIGSELESSFGLEPESAKHTTEQKVKSTEIELIDCEDSESDNEKGGLDNEYNIISQANATSDEVMPDGKQKVAESESKVVVKQKGSPNTNSVLCQDKIKKRRVCKK